MGLTDVELSVVLTDDDEVSRLNEQWRGKRGATDVLSFAQLEGEGPPLAGGPTLLGDVVISVDTAARQAREAGHDLEREVQQLLLHGVLHLLGHDHQSAPDTRRMHAEEQRILAVLAELD